MVKKKIKESAEMTSEKPGKADDVIAVKRIGKKEKKSKKLKHGRELEETDGIDSSDVDLRSEKKKKKKKKKKKEKHDVETEQNPSEQIVLPEKKHNLLKSHSSKEPKSKESLLESEERKKRKSKKRKRKHHQSDDESQPKSRKISHNMNGNASSDASHDHALDDENVESSEGHKSSRKTKREKKSAKLKPLHSLDTIDDEPPVQETEKRRKTKDKKKKARKKQKHDEDKLQNGKASPNPSSSDESEPDSSTQTTRKAIDQQTIEKVLTKRPVYLHGPSNIRLLTKGAVQKLDDAGKHAYFRSSAHLCERLVNLIHKTIVASNRLVDKERKEDFVSVEEALTGDMARLKKVPIAKQYTEMTLWNRILEMNQDQLLAASRTGFGKEKAHPRRNEKDTFALHNDDDPDAEFVSYREAYMTDLVDRYKDSLDKMRENENMDSSRAKFLLRCLDAGSGLFGNLKCLERREKDSMN